MREGIPPNFEPLKAGARENFCAPFARMARDDAALDVGLRIREYEARDDAGCKRLEDVASQFQAFRGLVKSAITHYSTFDAKAAQFPQRLLLVCTDDELPGAVVGVIAVAIKRAWLHGAMRKVAYVFDLRVDESHQVRARRGARRLPPPSRRRARRSARALHRPCTRNARGFRLARLRRQAARRRARALTVARPPRPPPPADRVQRRGIGLHLSREAERRIALAPYDVEYAYLSVNADNARAKALYSKLGWGACSSRALSFEILSAPASLGARPDARAALGAVERVADVADAARLTAEAYACRDLSLPPDELARGLFGSAQFLGTFRAADGAGSYAALSLWHGSAFTGFRPIRLGLPWAWWARAWPLAAAASAAGAIAAVRALALGAATRYVAAEPLAAVLFATAGVLTTYAALRAALFIRWAYTRTYLRARAFAPVRDGEGWEPLMVAVRARVHDEARKLGFAILVMNTDQRDPVNRAFRPPERTARSPAAGAPPAGAGGAGVAGGDPLLVPGAGDVRGAAPRAKRAPTEFWHKALSPALRAAAGGALAPLAPDAFFDPRDF